MASDPEASRKSSGAWALPLTSSHRTQPIPLSIDRKIEKLAQSYFMSKCIKIMADTWISHIIF